MTRTAGLINLSLMLSSLPWFGSALASNALDHLFSVASADEGPAIINNDARNPIINMSKKPVLQPKESAPLEHTYNVKNSQGKVCLLASLGVEFIVKENKKNYYFNINPSSTRAKGDCGNIRSEFSLEFDGGSLEFTFYKEGGVSYVKTIKGLLKPAPPCKNCQKKTYVGLVDHDKLFKADNGLSFKCKSETILPLTDCFRVKLVPLQIQAFNLSNGAFGKEAECWPDFNKRMLPIILGAVAAAVCLIAILTFVLVRERHRQGYEQL